jgi:hypothetical protein
MYTEIIRYCSNLFLNIVKYETNNSISTAFIHINSFMYFFMQQRK